MNVLWELFITIKALVFGNFSKEISQSLFIKEILTEIFKVKSGVAPKIMTKNFKFKDHSYDLRKNNYIQRRIIKSCKYGSETVSNLGAKLRDILPENIEKSEFFQDFLKKKKMDSVKLSMQKYVRHT